MQSFDAMGVQIHCGGPGGVAEQLLNHLGVDARGQGEGGAGVAGVVQSDWRQPRIPDRPLEHVRNAGGVVGQAVFPDKNQPVLGVGRPQCCRSLDERFRCSCKAPTATSPRSIVRRLVPLGALVITFQSASVVRCDATPIVRCSRSTSLQPRPASSPRRSPHTSARTQAAYRRSSAVARRKAGPAPRSKSSSRPGAGREPGLLRGVRRQQTSVDGVVEGVREHSVHEADRGGSQAAAFLAAVVERVSVRGSERRACDGGDSHPSDSRRDAKNQDAAIAGQGSGGEGKQHAGQPLVRLRGALGCRRNGFW